MILTTFHLKQPLTDENLLSTFLLLVSLTSHSLIGLLKRSMIFYFSFASGLMVRPVGRYGPKNVADRTSLGWFIVHYETGILEVITLDYITVN